MKQDTISEALDLMPLQDDIQGEVVVVEEKAITKAKEILDTVDTDVSFARDNLKSMIMDGTMSLKQLMIIAEQSEAARAYEVVATLIKVITQANKDLIELQKTKYEVKALSLPTNNTEPGGTINNNLFVGSTHELQKLLQKAIHGNDG